MRERGNPSALKEHKEASQKETRKALELALSRLRNGNPRKAKRGSAITPSTVAKEAGIDRSTLYRFHEPILSEIRKFNESTQKKKLEGKQSELSAALSKLREYRTLIETNEAEIKIWANQNYSLSHRIQELENILAERDRTVADLRLKLQEAGNLVTLHPS